MAEDSRRLYDCWSDDGGSGTRPCRPCVVKRTQLYCCDNAGSDSSLHSCNSSDALKQWTATSVICPRWSTNSARCWRAKACRKQRRSKSANGDGGQNASSDLMDANDCYSTCTFVVFALVSRVHHFSVSGHEWLSGLSLPG